MAEQRQYSSVAHLLRAWRPEAPVYAVFPAVYEQTARSFVQSFRGRVLYAVKANDHPMVIEALCRGGVRHFDCASLDEVATVNKHGPEARAYFMIPARRRGAAKLARQEFGVRHFMVDHASGLEPLLKEVGTRDTVVFTRLAVHHPSAHEDLSSKFGASPAETIQLLNRVADTGAEAALAFNVGSGVMDPEAYAHAMEVANGILQACDPEIRLIDVGGGFPRAYPDFPAPPVDRFLRTIEQAREKLVPARHRELLCEPGRALAAPGMSALVEVVLRKPGRLYLNDGMYGIFWELRFGMQSRYAVRAWRDGEPLAGNIKRFDLFGPTCDSSDRLPGAVMLPDQIQAGDYLEFGGIGAYSLSGKTAFNGLGSDQVVCITGPGEVPTGDVYADGYTGAAPHSEAEVRGAQ